MPATTYTQTLAAIFMRTQLMMILALLAGTGTVLSQSLSPESKKVKMAFDQLTAAPTSEVMQAEYIAAFPNNTKAFLKVFSSKEFDQLYQYSFEYLDALEKCGKSFPGEVIDKCIEIGKNLVWDADAVGHLQKLCVEMASKNPTIFTKKFEKLRIAEQDSLISYFADVENHSAFRSYQSLIDALKSQGRAEIINKLEIARSKRKSRTDH